MTPHYGLYFGCEQRSSCQIVLEMWKKNSYAYLQSLGYYQANVHLLHMHFLVLSLPQNSSSGRGCKNKHQNFASWHNMGQIMDSLWTVQKNDELWSFLASKFKYFFFCDFQPFYASNSIIISCWNFRALVWSEKSIEKINIHNVKIWTFRTSSSWENMTHEIHMQLYSRQRTIFFAASVMTNVSSMSTYNTDILFLKDRKDAWRKNATNGNLSLLSFFDDIVQEKMEIWIFA